MNTPKNVIDNFVNVGIAKAQLRGGKQMLLLLEKIAKGRGTQKDIEELRKIAVAMQKASLCGLGQTAPNPVLSTMRYFGEEYEAKVAANEAKNREAK